MREAALFSFAKTPSPEAAGLACSPETKAGEPLC